MHATESLNIAHATHLGFQGLLETDGYHVNELTLDR